MDVNKIKTALLEQRRIGLSGSLYHKTQIDFAYNTNHIEGSTITLDETASIYDTFTILSNTNKVINLVDVTETKNHFKLFNYMLDTLDEPLTQDMIKKFHFILKDGTLNHEEESWFNVGEYKKLNNYVGNITTTSPGDVESEITELLTWYNKSKKTIDDIIYFHVKFEKIHPFSDGNGRVGRIIMFKETLVNDIMPFYIEDRNKDFYIRGIKEYQLNGKKSYLTDTIKNSEDNYEKLARFFLED